MVAISRFVPNNQIRAGTAFLPRLVASQSLFFDASLWNVGSSKSAGAGNFQHVFAVSTFGILAHHGNVRCFRLHSRGANHDSRHNHQLAHVRRVERTNRKRVSRALEQNLHLLARLRQSGAKLAQSSFGGRNFHHRNKVGRSTLNGVGQIGLHRSQIIQIHLFFQRQETEKTTRDLASSSRRPRAQDWRNLSLYT